MLDSRRFKAIVKAYMSTVAKVKNIYFPREGEAILECIVDSTFSSSDMVAEQEKIKRETGWDVRIFPHYISRDIPIGVYDSLCRAVGGLKNINRISFYGDTAVVTHYKPGIIKREDLESESKKIGKIEIRDGKGRTLYVVSGEDREEVTLPL